MKTEQITPEMPFVWPEPRVSAGMVSYSSELPFEGAVRSAAMVFGVVSAVDSRAINWMEGFLADQAESQLRVVFSIHPTCRTTEADLQEVMRLVDRHGARAAFRLYPEKFLTDHSSNLLCRCGVDAGADLARVYERASLGKHLTWAGQEKLKKPPQPHWTAGADGLRVRSRRLASFSPNALTFPLSALASPAPSDACPNHVGLSTQVGMKAPEACLGR